MSIDQNTEIIVHLTDGDIFRIRAGSISSEIIENPEEAVAALWKTIAAGEAVFCAHAERPWILFNPTQVRFITAQIWN